jgi:hypothetical protein
MPRPKLPLEPIPPLILDPWEEELHRRIGKFLALGKSLGDPRNRDDRDFWIWVQYELEVRGLAWMPSRGQGGFQFPRETYQAAADLEWDYITEESKKPRAERRSMAEMAADYVHANTGRLKDPFATPRELLFLWKRLRQKPPAWWPKR